MSHLSGLLSEISGRAGDRRLGSLSHTWDTSSQTDIHDDLCLFTGPRWMDTGSGPITLQTWANVRHPGPKPWTYRVTLRTQIWPLVVPLHYPAPSTQPAPNPHQPSGSILLPSDRPLRIIARVEAPKKSNPNCFQDAATSHFTHPTPRTHPYPDSSGNTLHISNGNRTLCGPRRTAA